MKILQAFKYQLVPKSAEATIMRRFSACCRFFWGGTRRLPWKRRLTRPKANASGSTNEQGFCRNGKKKNPRPFFPKRTLRDGNRP
ncbi:MAG: helix-turn-helix domain-containing protein [Desulfovibrio sp.]|nr:helix-turn-helix domain-containing protein [Desulfovibrio sp.]